MPARIPGPRRLLSWLALSALVACGDRPDREVDPPVLADRIFTASTDSMDAFAYLTRENRLRPGPTRLARRFDRYTLYVRRMPDGAIVKALPLGDLMNAMEDSTPRIIAVADGVLWVQRDSVEGYRLPALEPVRHPVTAGADTALRARLAEYIARPLWQRPGSARLFTQVSSGLLPFERGTPLASLALARAGVLMRADRSAWQVDEPASTLVVAGEADSLWSVSRITPDGARVWNTTLPFQFLMAFVLLDATTHVVFIDTQSHADRSGVRDRVAWVNVMTGEAHVLEVADGTVTALPRR